MEIDLLKIQFYFFVAEKYSLHPGNTSQGLSGVDCGVFPILNKFINIRGKIKMSNQRNNFHIDGLVKSQNFSVFVIPAKAGIQ
jgi:hypothetical protein